MVVGNGMHTYHHLFQICDVPNISVFGVILSQEQALQFIRQLTGMLLVNFNEIICIVERYQFSCNPTNYYGDGSVLVILLLILLMSGLCLGVLLMIKLTCGDIYLYLSKLKFLCGWSINIRF